MQRPHMVQTVVGGKQDNIKTCCAETVSLFKFVLFGTVSAHTCMLTRFLCFSFQEQYDFCYRVVQDFVDIFSDYANFK